MAIEIPAKIKVTLFFNMGVGKYNQGRISVTNFDSSSDPMLETILLFSREAEFDIPQGIDATGKAVAFYEQARAATVQEFSGRLKGFDDKLAELRALPASAGEH